MNRYPPELNEAIWALMKAGCGPTEIKRRLDSGEAALELARPIPYRTVQHKMTMLRRSRGEPDVDGLPLEELAETVAGEIVNVARQQLRKIREAARGRSITPEEALVLKHLAATVNVLHKSVRHRNRSQPRVGRLPGQATKPTPKRLLEILAQQDREARSAANGSNGTA